MVAAILASQGKRLFALTVDYGQRHGVEIDAAKHMAQTLGCVEHLIQKLDLRAIGGSALTSDVDVPKGQHALEPVAADIPVTYVPARNTLFLSLALAYAESRRAQEVGIGVNALDYSGYPDCRPEFIEQFQEVARLGTRTGVSGSAIRIVTPLQNLSKAQILARAQELGVDVSRTISCYDPQSDAQPCGLCDACRLRARAEQEWRAYTTSTGN